MNWLEFLSLPRFQNRDTVHSNSSIAFEIKVACLIKSGDLEIIRTRLNGDHMCLEKLLRIVTPVNEGEEGFLEWSEQSSFLNFLAEQRTGRSIILYSSCFNNGSLLLHSILVPINALDAVKPDDMMHWDDPRESWSCGLVYGGGQPPR